MEMSVGSGVGGEVPAVAALAREVAAPAGILVAEVN